LEELLVHIKKESVFIDKEVFLKLLDIPYIQEFVDYQRTIANNEIKLEILKELANRAQVPYPLFFAPLNIVLKQIEDNDKELESKMATKDEINLNFRGKMKKEDVALIVKDIGKKQMFLKKFILKETKENEFIGYIQKLFSAGKGVVEIAESVRAYFNIELSELRKSSKETGLEYLKRRLEVKNVFISVSSYNYMPQEISPQINLSAIGVKDRHFPFIFLNTRDGDDNPLVLETAGRQIFTLLCMLVSIGLNRYVLSTKKGQLKEQDYNQIYQLAGEILIPSVETVGVSISNIEDLKEKAHFFKVTPSMLLTRLLDSGNLKLETYVYYLNNLKEEIKKAPKHKRRAPKPITGYRKYNGERFSREVVKAFKDGKISKEVFKKILFRKNNINENVFNEYIRTFR
jgi:Zn-dependent peptidase ImmA (M78 family)